MKTFEDQFRVVVEFRSIGVDAVVARLTPSVPLVPSDSLSLGTAVLSRLLPAAFVVRPLSDGSFLIVSDDDSVPATVGGCADSNNCSLGPFDLTVELPDGFEHLVKFSLNQSDGTRRDYIFRDARFIDLRGVIKVDIDDDEASEN